MKVQFNNYLKLSLLVLSANFATITFILLSRTKLPPLVPLFYGKPQGAAQLSNQLNLIIPSMFAIVVTILNTLFIHLSHKKFFQQVLLAMSIAITLLSTITTTKIALLVGTF